MRSGAKAEILQVVDHFLLVGQRLGIDFSGSKQIALRRHIVLFVAVAKFVVTVRLMEKYLMLTPPYVYTLGALVKSVALLKRSMCSP